MRGRPLIAIEMIILHASVPGSAFSQTTYPDDSARGSQFDIPRQLDDDAEDKVADVQLLNLAGVAQRDLRLLIDTRIGQPLDLEVLDGDLKKLYATGWFEDIRVLIREVEASVQVNFVFEELPTVRNVELIGNRKLKARRLMSLLRLSPSDCLDPSDLSAALLRIRDHYRREGYAFAEIDYRAHRTDHQADLVVVLDEKEKVLVDRIHFVGNKHYSRKELLLRMKTRERVLLFFREVYRERQFTEDVRAIEDLYRSSGFFDVQADGTIEYSFARKRIELTVRIDEGRRYVVDRLETVGNNVFSDDRLLREFATKPDTPFDQRTVDADLQFLRNLYGRQGYANARFRVARVFPKQGDAVNLRVEIQEGEPVRLGQILVHGLEFTKPQVVVREFTLKPGDLLDTLAIRHSTERLGNLGYFKTVQVDKEETARTGFEDLVVELAEAKPNHIRFGAGYSTDRGAIGMLEFRSDNFDLYDWPVSIKEFVKGRALRGAGQRMSISLQPGFTEEFYQLRFEEPYLLGRPIVLDVDVHHYQRSWSTYRERRSGAVVGLAKRLSQHNVVDLSYRLELVNIGRLDFWGAPQDAREVQGDNLLSALVVGLTRDCRDDPYFPTRGYLLVGDVEFAGVGGDHSYVKWKVKANRHVPLAESDRGPHVLNLLGRLGVAYGDIPLFERFYAGGADSLRGFAYREAGPHDGDDPVGGKFLLTGGVEYEFPIVRTKSTWLRGVVFSDFGWINSSVRLSDLRMSAGAGLRFHFPGMKALPIAVDVAWPVARERGDESEIVNFRVRMKF